MKGRHRNFERPNFVSDGQLFLVKCFACEPERGHENWKPAAAGGYCYNCGWSADGQTEGQTTEEHG